MLRGRSGGVPACCSPSGLGNARAGWGHIVLVVLHAQVSDLLFTHQPAQCVLQFRLLDEQILLGIDAGGVSDGGGLSTTSRRPQHGARKIARGMIALTRRPPQAGRLVDVNGAPGVLLRDADGTMTVIAFTIDAGLITAVDVMRNPDKLRRLPSL
jgi:hypothetical protein